MVYDICFSLVCERRRKGGEKNFVFTFFSLVYNNITTKNEMKGQNVEFKTCKMFNNYFKF